MILPDLNLLIHAYNLDSPHHADAKAWWQGLMEGSQPVGLAWVVILGFLRISTHRRILENPLPVPAACDIVRSWLAQPQVLVVHPGRLHSELLLGLLSEVGSAGNLTTDAHIAALALEIDAEVQTTDGSDFARFPGLRWRNPLDTEAAE